MRILLIGYGAMGKRIEALLAHSKTHHLMGVITHQEHPLKHSWNDPVTPDVIIDFSSLTSLQETLHYACKHQIPLVLATTGLEKSHLAAINKASHTTPILLTSNTSYGVQVILSLLKVAVPLLKEWDIEVIEKHHHHKLDAPSGTAKTIVETIENASTFAHEKIFGRHGNSKRLSKEIGIHAIRGGSIVGEHQILFCGPHETIEITHTALSKDIFAQGAIVMAEKLINRPAKLYAMNDLIETE